MEQHIALALAIVAVVLSIVILTKVNKLLTMLRTPVFKKLTPDMNLKPNSRRAISSQEMAQRGERNNKENRQKDNKPVKESRENKAAPTLQQNRNDQRNERVNRRDRREGRPERPRREFNNAAPAVSAAPATSVEQNTSAAASFAAPEASSETRRPVAPTPVTQVDETRRPQVQEEARRPLAQEETRRPLAPRVPLETPEAPVAPVETPVAASVALEPVETTFAPSKVRYGRRNVIKKVPELSDDVA